MSGPEVVAHIAQVEREFSVYQRKEGIFLAAFCHCECEGSGAGCVVAAWWSAYGRHLPILSSIAPRVLAQAAAASAAERNWSVYGQIQAGNKSRMKHATADKLVYCHEAMHVQLRMQDAGLECRRGALGE